MFSSVKQCSVQWHYLYFSLWMNAAGRCCLFSFWILWASAGSVVYQHVRCCVCVFHPFTWCLTRISGLNDRYGPDLIWTVLVMAEGTCTGEMPSFDLSPSFEAKKRPNSSDGSESSSGFCAVCVSLLHPQIETCHNILHIIFFLCEV